MRYRIPFFSAAAIVLAMASPVSAQTMTAPSAATADTARGTFDVQMQPAESHDDGAGQSRARMTLTKQFRGGLEGTGAGEMLTAGTATEGSAGYVAIERVTGTLNGRTGGFALQHTGVLTRGTPQLSITIVPDSGTGELAGIAGTFSIDFSGGGHAYTLVYTLPAAR